MVLSILCGVWVVLPNLCGAWVVLSILCGAWVVLSILCESLGSFIYSVWVSRWFYLFCVGVWLVLSILGGFIYSVWCLCGFTYSV